MTNPVGRILKSTYQLCLLNYMKSKLITMLSSLHTANLSPQSCSILYFICSLHNHYLGNIDHANSPEYDWCFKSTPQPALNNRIIAQPRGKVLGGTSAINFLMASHGTASEFQHWEELGNPGWNWESMLQYYRKSETFNSPTEEQAALYGTGSYDRSLYGSDGPVQLTMPIGTGASDASWQPTLQALGIPSDKDPRVPGSLGGWPLLKYTDSTGKRSYAASAYYASIAGRPNLTVLTSAYVTKMILDPPEMSGGSAKVTSVSFVLDEKEHVVRATKETILAGGSYMSPKLLELSGIGSSSLLQKLGIDVVVDNAAVGENLQVSRPANVLKNIENHRLQAGN